MVESPRRTGVLLQGTRVRLLFVSHSFPPTDAPLENVGGMQRVAVELFDALQADPAVDVVPLVARGPWKGTGFRTVRFMAGLLGTLPARAREADVVLFSSMVTAWLAPFWRRRVGRTPLVAIAHGRDVTLPTLVYQQTLPRVLRSLDLILPVSTATGAELVARGAEPGRVVPLPNGVDTARFEPAPDGAAARAAFVDRGELGADAALLFSVGRQVERKGTAWFVREVLPGLPAHVHYWVAGDGPELPAIEAAAREAGVADRLRLLGRVSEEALRDLLAAADLFVMPNVPVAGDMEGFGVVMLEAALSGTPVVASRLEGIRDVVVDGENGFFVAPLDADGFRARIAALLADPDALAALSARAARTSRERFAWPGVARRYAETLAALTGQELGEGGEV